MKLIHLQPCVWYWLLVLPVLTILSGTSDALWSRCPSKCKCHSSWIRGITTVEVDCSSKNLVRIPTTRDGLPRDVTKLVLFKNYIQEIPKNAFSRLRYLKEIYLYENFITKIDKDAFRGMRRVKILSLHHNRLTKIDNGTFRHLSGLENLHLFSNFLEAVNPGTFTGLRRLKILSLHENHLRSIPKDSFSPLRRLQFLSLYRNHLTEITAGVFCDSNNLLQLYIAQNKISKIEDGSFVKCGSMVKLTIGYNRLSNMTNSTFTGLTNLEELFLNNNYIKYFPTDVFRQLGRLKKLSLGSNKIQKLEKGTFVGLTSVSELSLSGNKLSELLPYGFIGLTDLRILALEDNSIVRIRKNAFHGLRNVVTLYLYRNQISNIPSHAFSGLDSLTELNLGVNRIASIDNEAFFGLSNLLSLSLNSNRLTVIPAHAFKGLSLLQKLTLYFNRVRYVAEGALRPLRGLTLLSWNPPSSLIRFHPKLQTIRSNILHCDCNAFWLQEWVKTLTSLVPPKIACASPRKFKGKKLMSIKKEDFPCDPFQVQIVPNNTFALEEGSTSFKCTVLPGAIYSWVHNGKKIAADGDDDDKYSLQHDGLLEINRIEKEDEGTYICLAENKAGLSAASATLALGTPPIITEHAGKEVVVDTPDRSIVLPCKAQGYPEPMIHWVKDGTKVVFDERILRSTDGALVILSMKRSDEGIYSCIAANTFGTNGKTVRLYLGQGSMCLPSCRRDSGFCVKKYECQCLKGFNGPSCEHRDNEVPGILSVSTNNSIEGKAAKVLKVANWVYDPLEMKLHEDGSGDDDTEPDPDEDYDISLSDKTEKETEAKKVKLLIKENKLKESKVNQNVERKVTTEDVHKPVKKKENKISLINRKIAQQQQLVSRGGRSPKVHSLQARLLVIGGSDSASKGSGKKNDN